MKLHEHALRLLTPKRPPDRIIGGADDPYMHRWHVIPRNPIFNVYLHHFMRSDDDRALHDHPWWNASWLLQGRYKEVVPMSGEPDDSLHVTRYREAGDFAFRRASAAHRVELHREMWTLPWPGSREIPCWTLFITGPRFREWGFWCPKGWRHHSDYAKVLPGGVSEIGRGCDD